MKNEKVYVGGTFDLLHPGHIALLQKASAYGDVVVSLNTDEFAERYKRKPVMSLEERKQMVRSLRCVSDVVVNIGCEDSTVAIMEVKPRYIVHGNDWTGESLMKQMGLSREFLRENNIQMLYLPYTEGVSTTELLERVTTR